MPRITDDDTMEEMYIGTSNFNFSGTRLEHLAASEYTLVTIGVDTTGSVGGFEKQLVTMLKMVVVACKKSPRAENLMIRVIKFSSRFNNGVEEIHGFKMLSDIDPDNDYPDIQVGGMTPLLDALFSGVGAMCKYGEHLIANRYTCNGILFVITDGAENDSTATESMVKQQLAESVKVEVLESLVSVLIGINAKDCLDTLTAFKDNIGLTQFVDAGDATEGRIAKLAAFISQSTSSTSQALGTKGPSQNITLTI